MKHTKGDWKVFDAYKDTHGICIGAEGYGELARCKGKDMEANAQLISAAPDLYEACKMAQEGKGDWRGMIDLALTKAEVK